MGRRMLRGDALYRDLSENKPPLGYWLYELAVGIGGANELTVRLMAMPYVLATASLVWWIGLRLGGGAAACLGALVFVIASADPYVFGNGSNMEHFLNLFSVASLALMLRAADRRSRWAIVAAGVCVALATLVKQVAAAQGLVYAVVLALPAGSRSLRDRLGDLSALAAGFVVPWVVALGVLVAQGAGGAAYEDMVLFARAMATEGPPNLHGPPGIVRWITGNADPEGKLPWPFGTSTYYVWWGAGLWPLWVASLPATIRLLVAKSGGRRLLGWWVVATWVQVILPGMYWQHYYMLLAPGIALAVSLWLVDAVSGIRARPAPNALLAIALLAALGWTLRIQFRDYLGRTPDEITSEFKGGRQWVGLRTLGRDIAARSKVWDDPRLFVWGWQSPLYIYSGLDGVTRHFFANDFLKAHATDGHTLVGPWIDEILRDLHARPPALILAGDPPFPALKRFLDERYLPSLLSPTVPDGRGLWVEKDRYGEFHARPTVRP